jgi:hypothetical protein
VKVLAGLGAWFGPHGALAIFCIEAVIGAGFALAFAAREGRTGALFRNSALLAVNLAHVNDVGVDHVAATGQSSRAVKARLPWAVPLLTAVMVFLAAAA